MVGREAGVSLLWPELTLGWRRAARGPLLVALAAVLAFCLLALPGRADAGLVRTGYGVVLAWMVLIVSALWCGGTAYALDRERHIPLALNNDKVAALVAVFGKLNKIRAVNFIHNFPLRTKLGMR